MSSWSRRHRHWANLIAVIALVVGSLALPLAKPVAADSSNTISGHFTGPGGVAALQGISVNADSDAFHVGTPTDTGGNYSLAVQAGSWATSSSAGE